LLVVDIRGNRREVRGKRQQATVRNKSFQPFQ
jgi:hypothetical protein